MKRVVMASITFALLALAFGGGLSTLSRTQAQEPTPEPQPGIRTLGISPVLCLVFTNLGGAAQLDVARCVGLDLQGGNPPNLQFVADFHGDGDGVVEPSDFAAIDLDGNRVHQNDRHEQSAGQGTLWVLAFVPDDDAVTFKTNRGYFRPGAGNDPTDKVWVCDTQAEDEDCDNDGIAGDGVVVARLRSNVGSLTSDPGEGRVTITQGTDEGSLDFRFVGEPDSVGFLTLENVIQNGVRDLDGDGALGSEGECPLPGDAPGFLAANGTAERAIVLAIVRDSDGIPVTNAFVEWSTDDEDKAVMAAPLTPTIDLGAFGFGAPNIICGTSDPGEVTVKAKIVRAATGVTLDEAAELDEQTIKFTVKGLPDKIELKAEPETVNCDGRTASKVTATVLDKEGNPVAAGQRVRFDVRVLGTASPINATTNADGVATSTITPLAGGTAGVPVTVTSGNVVASILVKCSAGAPAGAAPPPPPPPPTAAPSGQVAPAVRQPGLPRSGEASLAGRAATTAWFAALSLAGVGLASMAGAVVRRRM
ncbi:MAG TPA: Ig-like domain-containing protein [Dehalococcoidia bacterium]|nr:Ig-like domain-containing protein [Dehalococcoidia bacterium]